jgi:hypothetical protein
MGISTDPIIQKVYTNQGEQDQVENTIQFAKLQHQINSSVATRDFENLNLVLGKLNGEQ